MITDALCRAPWLYPITSRHVHPDRRTKPVSRQPIAGSAGVKNGLDGTVGKAVITRSSAVRALSFLPLGLMAAMVLVTYTVIVWTLPRGFDWTDEAFGYALIASNRIAVDAPLGFQHLLHPLYLLTGQSVLAFRILRLAGYVLLSLALVSCARTVVRRLGISIPRSGWAFILFLGQVGTFLAWSYAPRYPGYNELASWFAQLGVALIVVSLAWGASTAVVREPWWGLWLIWAGLGAITTLLVYAKVTSGMAFGVMLAVAVAIPNPSLRWWKRIVSAAAGAMAVLLVLWVTGAPTLSYLKRSFSLVFDTSAQASFGHPMSRIAWGYWDSLISTGSSLLPVLVIFALTMATFSRHVRSNDLSAGGADTDRITWILGVLLVIAMIALPKLTNWAYLGELVVFIGAAGIIGLAILGSQGATLRGSTASRSLSVAFGGSAVVSAPFVSAAGTGNQLTGQFVFAATMYAVVLGIALVLLTQRATLLRSSARSVPALIGCVVILMAAVAVKADIAKPYRTPPLRSQETSSSVPELRGLLLAKADAAYVDWISAAGRTLGADGIPATGTGSAGDLYVFNHSGYASPWIGSVSPGPYASLVVACTKHPPADLFVLQRPSAPSKSSKYIIAHLTSSLAACGINFPGDFTVVAKRDSTDPNRALTIWRLKKSSASS